MEKEIWKIIPNYEEYQVSNFGNIKSRKNGKEKILKPINNNCGYKKVSLSKKGKVKAYYIHQLVAICFLNHIPNGVNITVDHINNDKLNNHLSNLQLMPHTLNISKGCRNKKSKYIGVSWNKSHKKWMARRYFNGKYNFLGRFNSELEASNAYQNAIRK